MKTVTVKTSELEGAPLDWAVASAEGRADVKGGRGQCYTLHTCERQGHEEYRAYQPSTDWAQGGPLIEANCGNITFDDEDMQWWAYTLESEDFGAGSTPLIAAMRAIVASELGDTVDVPEELAQ